VKYNVWQDYTYPPVPIQILADSPVNATREWRMHQYGLVPFSGHDGFIYIMVEACDSNELPFRFRYTSRQE
jgi:hypothetical protein